MSSTDPESLFQMVMQIVMYAWPLITVAMVVAGVLVIQAKLHHPGWAIVIGGSLSLMVFLWRLGRILNLFQSDDPEVDSIRNQMMIGQMIAFVGNGLIAYGMLVLAWIVFKQRRERQFDYRDD